MSSRKKSNSKVPATGSVPTGTMTKVPWVPESFFSFGVI